MRLALFGPRSFASLRPSHPDRLRVCGAVARELELSFADLLALPAEQQIANVGHYVQGMRGQAARLTSVLALAGPKPGPLYINAGMRDGEVRVALFRTEVEPLGLVVYAQDGKPLTAAQGGPFRLLLPGYHDAARELSDLGWIELAKSPGPDNRAALESRHLLRIGRQDFDERDVWRDPGREGAAPNFVIPPPNA